MYKHVNSAFPSQRVITKTVFAPQRYKKVRTTSFDESIIYIFCAWFKSVHAEQLIFVKYLVDGRADDVP